MTTLQDKLIQAAKLLTEARALAQANVHAYREQHPENTSLERRFDNIRYELITNRTITVEGLVDMAARVHLPLLTETPDAELLEDDQKWIFRRYKEFQDGK